ncbi:type II toxin-antitoxin system RelE/ParE family toxin [Propionimicrobium sp. PCR01-08-3]|uniref:type II toxin-antitoxin system RelE/ParE family toxin n=1 Tax=Propionimicrobium sp. PCR01-08-3 TaxID=3052086 RepID=UPI00255CB621|nr:type II toxin-antitoxin system RelE/ParE family toxin [Propionimicrobium sp. PCR01-08-3]WIY82608.1 type II toxin-antitoxin system RelE/ParE family toxin [Propionimicrobium sp. PCR01-08-3]
MRYRVVYSRQAQQHLDDIFVWIADQSRSSEVAEHFVLAISGFCDGLTDFPYRGNARDDLLPGLRTIGFRRRVIIAFIVTETTVEIFGVYYGGRDYETLIQQFTGPNT